MHFLENFSLQSYNTFGIEARARFFKEVADEDSLLATLAHCGKTRKELFVLGGGSNVLFMSDLDRVVLRNAIGGIQVLDEDTMRVRVKVGGGMVWHQFVLYAVSKGWGGIENLSLIPGTVGASPIQNIGAYGVELKDVFDGLEAIHVISGEKRTFNAAECEFGYRDSVFKRAYRGQWIITAVVFKLWKQGEVNTSYGDIKRVLAELGVSKPGIADVSRAVIQIRQQKLPDPAMIGNAGSFFKNPEVAIDFFAALKERFPNLPGYLLENSVKVPAGWLIEQAGWKGHRSGNVGVHERQALVLVNFGGARGVEVQQLATQIQESVNAKFGIFLTPEVNYVSDI